MPRHLILDHSIVGQSAVPNLQVRKDRNLAACRICGDIFQPHYYLVTPGPLNRHDYLDPDKMYEAEKEIIEWRLRHNTKHSPAEHMLLAMSGKAFTAEAAHKLAPFGLVPIDDALNDPTNETNDALMSAPYRPRDDVETTLQTLQNRRKYH